MALDLARTKGERDRLGSTNLKLASEILDVQFDLAEKVEETAKVSRDRDEAREQVAGEF